MLASKTNFKLFVQRGEPFVWLTSTALALITLMAIIFIVVILSQALGFFWPKPLVSLTLSDQRTILGEIVEHDVAQKKVRVKIGNRELTGQDFIWLDESDIIAQKKPLDAVAIERLEYGNFYGYLRATYGPSGPDHEILGNSNVWTNLQNHLKRSATEQAIIAELMSQMDKLANEIEQITQKEKKYRYQHPEITDNLVLQAWQEQLLKKNHDFQTLHAQIEQLEQQLHLYQATFSLSDGTEVDIPIQAMVHVWQPNTMPFIDKIGFYCKKVVLLLTTEPREANTEGGVFPAIFGTVMMVLIMSLFAVPFGVIAAIYLREYAKDGWFVRLVRICVNNLAGVPSIVYGVFGLGFFIYTVGGQIDQWFFPHTLPAPTFGTGGILWASLTLALLTVPVIIVSTEEALAAIPQEIRQGSLALGATKLQTLGRILIPMSIPGMLTGFILAMARAAGEVAPLMLTGAVKLAPQLPLDGTFPFLHLDRKFMHLGFHIYDLGFQSPNVEAILPMVYVTTALLLTLVVLLSLTAIILRNYMRRKYHTGVF